MARKSLWSTELRRMGWNRFLLNRLQFQRIISVEYAVLCSGRCKRTVVRQFNQLVATGKARWVHPPGDGITRVWQK